MENPGQTQPSPRGQRGQRIAIAVLLLLGAAWLWLMLCRFTVPAWNDIRLVPAFMLAHGEPIYSPPGRGVMTTWMYGPLPLVLLRPATLMPTIGSALIAAGVLNLALGIATLAVACACWPLPGINRQGRLLAFALGLLLWPESSWRYLQPDNAAVLCGIVSLVLLARHPAGAAPNAAAWGSAAAAVAALACKQVALGPILAGALWLAIARGFTVAAHHAVRFATVAASAGIASIAVADPAGLWLVLVRIPGGLPWVGDWAARARELGPAFAVAVALPAACLLAGRHRWFDRGSPHQLAACAWVACLPFGVLAAFKTGGSINSFHGFQFILPVILLDLASRPLARRWLPVAALALFGLLAWPSRGGPWQPSLGPANEAVALARAEPGRIWFPWHPLASWYAEGRFHHAEDGMYARFMAGQPLPYPQVRERLPEQFGAMALPDGFSDWGIASSLIPPGTRDVTSGAWRVWRWNGPETNP